MRVLVVYESLWGNTEQVARAIATGMAREATVEVVSTDEAPTVVDDYDLVVVGGPTHAFSMTRASTRQNAVDEHKAPRAPRLGIREWLVAVTPPDRAIPAATFDTRVEKPHLPGSAAKAAKRELRQLGFEIVAKQQSFHVQGYEGPVIEGELARAETWGHDLVKPAAVV